jgi:hypothetical protein
MLEGRLDERRGGVTGGDLLKHLPNVHSRRRMQWMVPLWSALFVLLALAITTGAAGSDGTPATCTTGDAEAAAATLFGPGSELVGTEEIAGLSTALVLEPRIYPGTRRRMIAAGGEWCEATAGFNRAWQLSGRPVGDGRAIAEAYASLAAAPYFDGVTIMKTDAGTVGTWTLSTHARTNGVEAGWVVNTDADGIRSATWTATAFAREPFEASWEGLTALPGATERYARVAGGLIEEARGLPTPASAQAGAASDEDGPGLLQHTFDDGYTIVTSIGDSHVGINPGVDTGVSQADKLRATMRAARENYEEFLLWGFSKGWRALPGFSDDVGYVYVNDALSAFCLACVFISDHFQIHLLSEVQVALDLLGYDGYRDRDQAYSLIIGHEMFHNFQNRYNRPGHFNQAGRGTPASYSEGTARFQETLHTYAGTTFAPNTLVTANDANGCNGFDTGGSMDAGIAAGPFGKTYNTCFFWGPWYVANGQQAFLDLIREAMPAHSPERNSFLEVSGAAAQAAGKPIVDQLVQFAGAAITGRGRAWATWFGAEPLDWGSLFERWTPTPMAPGGETTRSLGAGGMMAHEITTDARVTISASTDTLLYILRDVGTTVKARPANGNSIAVGAPTAGERIYALAVRPVAGSEPVTLRVGAPGPPPKEKDLVVAPAQGPVTGTVVTRAAGAGVRVGGVTSDYIVFAVPEGVDNARGEAVATYPLPGDIDLFLQRQNVDGTWSDIPDASGESGSLSGESMAFGRLGPGAYRIEVHNWAGPPGNLVSVTATFYNSAGQAGL